MNPLHTKPAAFHLRSLRASPTRQHLLGMVLRLLQLPSADAKHKLAYQNLKPRRPV